jgi:hypothetical protein
MSALEGFLFGVFGGLIATLPDFLRVTKLPLKSRPQWLKSPLFWLGVVIRVLFGGIVVIAYIRSGTPLNPILSINVGASLPFFIRTVGRGLPGLDPSKVQ